MKNIGRIFYGISIAVMGLLTIWYAGFPYMLIPPQYTCPVGLVYVSGALMVLAGVSIVFWKKYGWIPLLLGLALLAVFCLFLTVSPHYKHFGDGENAAKELALAAGALVIAGGKWRRVGTILFALTIISFAVDHFLYAHEAADYVPAWIPGHVFWLYVTGGALMGFGLAILVQFKTRLMATLLGAMILTWFVILHIPRVITAGPAVMDGEIASAFLALAYGGTAFMIVREREHGESGKGVGEGNILKGQK
ncbi:DoxX family protein [Dinghuibacter silviterrae]|uniref:DoxX-like protein n=1 Tax=Dinghuibacter silviterrae TaxID=1539049 RepID=A0A4R8DT44_9BACT|nr:hypothetical protein [Dinghuibacter silviterrae]TDX01056.1 hypothetical protein EDB95_2087 [Dinghuibacter silviterrae]